MAMMNIFQPMPPIFSAGIVWDPREPIPPEWHEAEPDESSDFNSADVFGAPHRVGALGGYAGSGRVLASTWNTNTNSGKHNVVNRQPTSMTPKPMPTGARGLTEAANPLIHTVNLALNKSSPSNPKPVVEKRHESYVSREPTRCILPPASIAITANVVHDTAKVILTQVFRSNVNEPIPKGSYTFPLPNGCSVTSFDCQIGEKRLKGSVKPKEEAKHEFNQAVRAGRQTGLLEQGTPEIFTASLGNIPPDTLVKAEITLTTLLKHRFVDKNNLFTLAIPTCIAERYGQRPENIEDFGSQNAEDGLSIQINVIQAEKVTSVTSQSHEITVSHGGTSSGTAPRDEAETSDHEVQTTTIKLLNNFTFLKKDFVLDIETHPENGLEEPQAWLEEHSTLQGHKALMLTIPPRFMAQTSSTSEAQEIIFVSDRSGSMDDKIKSLKSAMAFFLKGIPVGRRFNLWCFGSRFESLWAASMEYSEENLRRAEDYVSGFRADMGGTELLKVLEALIATLDSTRLCDIIILTDGQVWRLEQTLDTIQHARTLSEGRIRFFSLGIGSAVSHALVEGIAKSGGGYSEVIQAASQGNWEDRVVAMLRATLSKHIGPLNIELDPQPNQFSVTRSPADICNINPFQPSRIYMLFDEKGSNDQLTTITVKTQASSGEELSTKVPIHRLAAKDSTLHNLGARAVLEDLERGTSKLHLSQFRPQRGSAEEVRFVRREAEKIACKYNLASKWTSFLLESAEEALQENYQQVPQAKVDVQEQPAIVGQYFRQEAHGNYDPIYSAVANSMRRVTGFDRSRPPRMPLVPTSACTSRSRSRDSRLLPSQQPVVSHSSAIYAAGQTSVREDATSSGSYSSEDDSDRPRVRRATSYGYRGWRDSASVGTYRSVEQRSARERSRSRSRRQARKIQFSVSGSEDEKNGGSHERYVSRPQALQTKPRQVDQDMAFASGERATSVTEPGGVSITRSRSPDMYARAQPAFRPRASTRQIRKGTSAGDKIPDSFLPPATPAVDYLYVTQEPSDPMGTPQFKEESEMNMFGARLSSELAGPQSQTRRQQKIESEIKRQNEAIASRPAAPVSSSYHRRGSISIGETKESLDSAMLSLHIDDKQDQRRREVSRDAKAMAETEAQQERLRARMAPQRRIRRAASIASDSESQPAQIWTQTDDHHIRSTSTLARDDPMIPAPRNSENPASLPSQESLDTTETGNSTDETSSLTQCSAFGPPRRFSGLFACDNYTDGEPDYSETEQQEQSPPLMYQPTDIDLVEYGSAPHGSERTFNHEYVSDTVSTHVQDPQRPSHVPNESLSRATDHTHVRPQQSKVSDAIDEGAKIAQSKQNESPQASKRKNRKTIQTGTAKRQKPLAARDQKRLVHGFNTCQLWDGSFNLPYHVAKELGELGLKSAWDAIYTHVKDEYKSTSASEYDLIAGTWLVLFTIEKFCQKYKDLWEMMWEKGLKFFQRSAAFQLHWQNSLALINKLLLEDPKNKDASDGQNCSK